MEIFFPGKNMFFCIKIYWFSFRHCLSQQNNRTINSPFSHHQFTDLTNLIDYSSSSNSITTSHDHMNIFTDSDDINDSNGNKKFIAKRAQIGKNKINIWFQNQIFIYFFRYD